MKNIFYFTCEHATDDIPTEFQKHFENARHDHKSHWYFDIGALEVFHYLVSEIPSPHHAAQVSRLLIDCNRSLHHPKLFSDYTKPLDKNIKQEILHRYYFPYRNHIIKEIEAYVKNNIRVHHVSIHTFTPILHDKIRQCDIGFLFDPKRQYEKGFCYALKNSLLKSGNFLIRMNYPYRGNADGFTTLLRKEFQPEQYIGIEVEVNQKIFFEDAEMKASLLQGLVASLKENGNTSE